MNFKIKNSMDLEKSEALLEKNFKKCERTLNKDLQEIKGKQPILTTFEIGLNEELMAEETEKSDTRKITFSIKIFKRLEAFYTHAFNEKNENYYKSISTDNKFNQEKADFYKNLLLEMSINFLLLHEFGHIYNGHLLYKENENMNDAIHKVFEWNADDFATTRMIAMYAHPKVTQQLNDILNEDCIRSLAHMLFLIIQATAIGISIMNVGKKNRKEDNKHIHLRQRLIYILNNEIAVFNELNYNKNKYVKHKIDFSDEMIMLVLKVENLVNNVLNKFTDSTDWSIHNNMEELSIDKLEEVYQLNLYYTDKIQNKLKKYARFDPVQFI